MDATNHKHPDWQRFFGNQGLWRNDEHPEGKGESPTVSFHVRHAVDENVSESENYSLDIHHIKSFPQGRGFIPVLRYNGMNWGCNGDKFHGTDQETYDKAVQDGKNRMANKEIEDEKKLKELEG